MDVGTLRVYKNGLPLSMQGAARYFLGSRVTVDTSLVYNYLSRLGYIVRRLVCTH